MIRLEQHQIPAVSLITRFFLFLRHRDAKIVEMFFLGLHLWFLTVFSLPVGVLHGVIAEFYQYLPQTLLVIFEACVVGINFTALVYEQTKVRVISAFVNVAVMLVLSTAFFIQRNSSTGTYALLALLAAFVCWKVTVTQRDG